MAVPLVLGSVASLSLVHGSVELRLFRIVPYLPWGLQFIASGWPLPIEEGDEPIVKRQGRGISVWSGRRLTSFQPILGNLKGVQLIRVAGAAPFGPHAVIPYASMRLVGGRRVVGVVSALAQDLETIEVARPVMTVDGGDILVRWPDGAAHRVESRRMSVDRIA